MQRISLSDAVKGLREALGASQNAFAVRHVERSLTMVQRWEKGENIAPRELGRMITLSREAGRADLATLFRDELYRVLGEEVIQVIQGETHGAATTKTTTKSTGDQPARRSA